MSRSIGTGRVLDGGLHLRPTTFVVAEDPEQPRSDTQLSIQAGEGSGVVASGTSGSNTKGIAESIVGYEEPIVLTQSTHSFLFTEPTCSIPFAFALGIVGISYTCLILALYNNIAEENSSRNPFNVAVGVTNDVRIAQYFALLIGLIMEEEIPESLYLLRMISEKTLHDREPNLKFGKFVFCAVVRIVMGYLFYFNMFVVVVQATAVIDIFYDVLALQFLQQVDDIAFRLAQRDVFGKKLKRASTRKCFRAEFEKLPFARRKRMSRFVKVLYIINFLLLMAGMSVVVVRQKRGDYHCNSITVDFDDQIWENAVVLTNSTGGVEEMDLIYSYFNGVYVLNKTAGFRDGRPVYTEQNKFNNTPYEEKIGAILRYCKSEDAWVFMHENIRKDRNTMDTECPWLLRSPDTESFNLLEVSGDWSIWTGVINTATFKATCNGCDLDSESDCNYHGTCTDEKSDGKCVCDYSQDDGFPLYTGEHCEFHRPCLQIKGTGGGVFNAIPLEQRENEYDSWKAYGRGVYVYTANTNGTIPGTVTDFEKDDLILMYTGSRWFGSFYKGGRQNGSDFWLHYSRELHAFWDEVYKKNTLYVSNPTSRTTPIAVDFFQIGRRGEKYGPLGELIPLTKIAGSGYFECVDINRSIHDFVLEILEGRGN